MSTSSLQNKGQEFFSAGKKLANTNEGKILLRSIALPLFLIAVYLYAFMPNQYEVISEISVHDSTSNQAPSDLLSGLVLGAAGQDQNDIRLVQSYLQSPGLIKYADSVLGVKSHYSDSWDFLFGIRESSPQEDFIDFFRKRVSIALDLESNLLVISTRAYTPDFSLALNRFLLDQGEEFINRINQDIARSEMHFAEQEVTRSLQMFKDAQIALARFQEEKNIASPTAEGESVISIVYGLEAALAETKAALSETQTYLSNDSPQIKSLSARVEALEGQIASQKSRVTSSDSVVDGFNKLGVDYNDRLFNVELAKIVYETSVSSFEISRNQASKQLKHFLVASQPVAPEKAKFPRRGYWLITWLLVLVAIYGISRMVRSAIAEHRD